MKMKIVGAVGQVTGSCTWCIYEETGTQFLVDCGMVQGRHQDFEMRQKFAFDPHHIKFVLLTHAHLDHCGMLPLLRARGFCGKIFCTNATMELTKLQLQDCYQHINSDDLRSILGAGYFDRFKKKFPQYSIKPSSGGGYDDIIQAIVNDLPFDPCFHESQFGKEMPVSEDIFVAPLSCSHMLGATGFNISWTTADEFIKGICFSGDVGSANNDDNSHLSLLRANQRAHIKSNYLVCESTYGGQERDSEYKVFKNRIERLHKIISDTNFNTVVIPGFSMQRVQDILMDLYCLFRENQPSESVKIYVDSAMAEKFCEIYLAELQKTETSKKGKPYFVYLHKGFADRLGVDENLFPDPAQRIGECKTILGKVFSAGKWSTNVELAMGKLPKNPEKRQEGKSIIVTSSGMCQFGRVVAYLDHLKDEKTAWVLTGYQATPNGKYLKDLAAEKPDQSPFKLTVSDGKKETEDSAIESADIKGTIHDISGYYSGHADCTGLLDYLFQMPNMKTNIGSQPKPKVTVFLNHGMNPARRELRDAIMKRNDANHPEDLRDIDRVEIPHKNSPFFDLDKCEWVPKS